MPEIVNLNPGEYVEWSGFIAGTPVFALADGTVLVFAGAEKRIELHDGLSAAAPARDHGFLATGGEDGRVCKFDPGREIEELRSRQGKWVNAIACGPSGTVATACARDVSIFSADRDVREFTADRSVEALAFAPKGMRLALARYNGVELIWVKAAANSQFLEWNGAHIGVVFSPDGKYVVSSMQENALHGWRLADNRHMRMTGYPSKVKSVSFSRSGKWLASSGAPGAIVWPFSGKDGPMGKSPVELGSMGVIKVTRVDCHPTEEVVAIGYENGMVAAAQIADGKLAVLRREGRGPVSSLHWDPAGRMVAFGTEAGEAGIIDIAT
jgi:WD40 repeat protein